MHDTFYSTCSCRGLELNKKNVEVVDITLCNIQQHRHENENDE